MSAPVSRFTPDQYDNCISGITTLCKTLTTTETVPEGAIKSLQKGLEIAAREVNTVRPIQARVMNTREMLAETEKLISFLEKADSPLKATEGTGKGKEELSSIKNTMATISSALKRSEQIEALTTQLQEQQKLLDALSKQMAITQSSVTATLKLLKEIEA